MLTACDRKAYLDQLVSDAKIEVKPTAKTWEPVRAYEKKLVSIMHKGTSACVGVGRRLKDGARVGTGKGRRAKGGAVGTSDEESGPEAERGGAVEVEEAALVPVRERVRPRPRVVVRRSATPSEPEEHGLSDVEMDAGGEDEVVEETPKSRPRVREDDGGGGGEESPMKTPRAELSTHDHPEVPESSLKRRRDDDEADQEAHADAGAGAGASVDDDRGDVHPDELPPSEIASTALASPTSEFLIRRKRARHRH